MSPLLRTIRTESELNTNGEQRDRILVLASTFPRVPGDGTPEFVGDLCAELGREFETGLIVPMVPGAERHFKYKGIKVQRFRFFPNGWGDLADGAILENLRRSPLRWLQVPSFFVAEFVSTWIAIRRESPALIHAHWIIPQGLVAVLAAPRDIPIIVTTLGGDLYALDRWPLNRVMARILKHAKAITVMNSDMAQRVRRLAGDHSDIRILPMGVNLDMVEPSVAVSPSLKEGLQLLFVGRLVPKKGLDVLLDAMVRMKGENGICLQVVGDGPLMEELRIRSRGLPVNFRGALSRKELRSAYQEADILVVPSIPAASGDQDGLPVAMLEGMASGLPVVASRLPGIDEVILDGVNGRLVPPGDSGALAEAIGLLVEDRELRMRMGREAAKVAHDRSTTVVGLKYRDLVKSVILGRLS